MLWAAKEHFWLHLFLVFYKSKAHYLSSLSFLTICWANWYLPLDPTLDKRAILSLWSVIICFHDAMVVFTTFFSKRTIQNFDRVFAHKVLKLHKSACSQQVWPAKVQKIQISHSKTIIKNTFLLIHISFYHMVKKQHWSNLYAHHFFTKHARWKPPDFYVQFKAPSPSVMGCFTTCNGICVISWEPC